MKIKMIIGKRYFAKDDGSTYGNYDESVKKSGKREVRLLEIERIDKLMIITPVHGECSGTEYICDYDDLSEFDVNA